MKHHTERHITLALRENLSSDGELVKRCLIDVVKCIHSGKEADYSSIALSRDAMQRRQDDIVRRHWWYLIYTPKPYFDF